MDNNRIFKLINELKNSVKQEPQKEYKVPFGILDFNQGSTKEELAKAITMLSINVQEHLKCAHLEMDIMQKLKEIRDNL